jgi:hypothetical protein
MYIAVGMGITFDTRTLIMVIVACSAMLCSWLARIEASIDAKERP